MRTKECFVYIVTNKSHRVLYTGMSCDLPQRIADHKAKRFPKAFTAQYNAHKLVYFEYCGGPMDAILREKQIKAGSRAKKIALIMGFNPEWRDLYEDLMGK